MNSLRKLPLHEYHVSKSAKMSPFAGWQMPIAYGSSLEENKHTRSGSSLFDVSHMGEIHVGGKDALSFLNYVFTNEISACKVGQAIYSPLCLDNGGTVDDVILYRKSEDDFLLCVNASNISKDFNHLQNHGEKFDCQVSDHSDSYGQIAIQGPKSRAILKGIFSDEVLALTKMRFMKVQMIGTEVLIATTGYTGEDGFEICLPAQSMMDFVTLLESALNSGELGWAGLAARDSLRLEAGYPLYGNELTAGISPVQAGLSWSVDLNKTSFVGKDSLRAEKEGMIPGKVFYYQVDDRKIPRSGAILYVKDQIAGEVLSGGFSPLTQCPIGSAFVKSKFLPKINQQECFADVRGHKVSIKFGKPALKRSK